MSIPTPNLDDRDFATLMAEARRWIEQHAPGWTDLTPGDPGIVLAELFAYLTDIMIYRLNRVPDKLYVEFLRMIGVRLRPPAAARVTLRFETERPADTPVVIPRGTRVTTSRPAAGGEAPVFTTDRQITIEAGERSAEVSAHHGELVQGELAGTGTGVPGLSITARHPPIIAPTGDELDLLVAVEAVPGELEDRAPAIEFEGKPYRVWRETDSFAGAGPTEYLYVADRMSGVITFAPSIRVPDDEGELGEAPRALAAVPPAGRELRLWYRRGGGPEGNVAAGNLTLVKDPMAGVRVTNPQPATGGRSAESIDNALIRGPQELHGVERAVIASDYEAVAKRSSGAVARAKAFTMSALWRHARPGTVEVLLVPYLSEEEQGDALVPRETIQAHETEEARSQIQTAIDRRRPLGTTSLVKWARYKTVSVKARVVVRREENRAAVRARVERRLYQTITPLPTRVSPTGWRFGQALRVSNVFDIVLKEPGVRFADSVRLVVDEVPEADVTSIVADRFQPRTWYAGSGSTLFRSLNDGEGWEAAASFQGEGNIRIRVHPSRPGLVAVATASGEGAGSRIHWSDDAGETWDPNPRSTAFEIQDIAWITREDAPVLLLATDVGLYELQLAPGSVPVQVLVTPEDQDRGFYSVAVSEDVFGGVSVAVAAQNTSGIFLSSQGGAPNTFRSIGLAGEDVRVLAVQREGPRSFLWAGVAAAGGEDPGKGCFRWELRGDAAPPEGWVAFGRNWTAGSCWAIDFLGSLVVAATHHGGVVRLDASRSDAQWQPVGLNCGLPLRDPGRFLFLQVNDVAADPEARYLMAGGDRGVHRTEDRGETYEPASTREFLEAVALPDTWLFVSGPHEISVVSEDEAGGH